MDRRRFLATGVALSAGLPVVGQEAKGTIKIVSSLPRRGAARLQTDGVVNGIRLALAECKGEVAGFAVEYSDWDDADETRGYWSPELESENARRAAKDRDVVAYLGPYNSGAAMISMPILNEAGLVQVAPSTTWPGLTRKALSTSPGEPEKYRPSKRITFCRVCPCDDSQGPLSAEFAKSELKMRKVYILNDKELYGQGVASEFHERCKELKVEVLGHEDINPRQQDFTAQLKAVAKLNPDLLYFGGTTQSGGPQLARDMVAAGLKCPLLVPDGCYEQRFIEAAGPANVDGRCYATMVGIDPSRLAGKGAVFVNTYKRKYRVEPEPFAVYGYEAALVVLAAIQKAGKKDREAIRRAVVGTRDFDGTLGKWSFDADGDTTLQLLTVSKVEKGRFVPVKVMTRKPVK